MQPDDTNTTTQQRSILRKRSLLYRILRWLWIVCCFAIAIITVGAANGGSVNPEWWSFPAMLAMTFPGWLVLNLACGIINLCVKRKLAIVSGVALVLTFGPTWSFCPLNIGGHSVPEDEIEQSFNFMSFNAFGFKDDENIYPNGTNRSASEIIHSDADIICLQEVGYLSDMPGRHLYSLQVDSINDLYPHVVYADRNMASILSKYPLTEIELPQPKSRYSGWKAVEVDFKGEPILVISVHLESIGLNNEDKLIYHEMTDGAYAKTWLSGGKIIYKKLSNAFKQRAKQAKLLRHCIDSLNYKNVIVSGDFNDIADCYAMRVIEGNNLRSVFYSCGFGPRITYHNDRFYFNIDHTLYGGDLKAVKTWRGNVPSSDHYPIYSTFILKK